MKIRKFPVLQYFTMYMALLFIPISYGNATSVLEVSLNEIIQQSQFVFEGTVTAIEARVNQQKRIHTYVTLEIKDIIKGQYYSNIITLRFLGGTVGDLSLAIGDMQVPQKGEHGIYFVESLERMQVNPLYGWSQGHFIVENDITGVERVMTNKRLPIIGIMADEQIATDRESIPALNKGVLRDLFVAKDRKDNRGLTVDEFKMVLYKRMGKNK